MSSRTHRSGTWLGALAAMSFLCEPAHAYLDPGTGSLMLQMAIGAVAAAGAAISVYWHKLRRWFGGSSQPTRKPGDAPAEPQQHIRHDGADT